MRYLRETKAVSALEYAILAGVVVVGIVAALGVFTDTLKGTIERMGDVVTKQAKKVR